MGRGVSAQLHHVNLEGDFIYIYIYIFFFSFTDTHCTRIRMYDAHVHR